MSSQQSNRSRDRQALMVWVPGFLVAIGAGAATAHGLFTVATASGVPGAIAWVYPLITDGLALVAYAAATRLSGSARGYAWFVVVLAAGLSGLAQASYLLTNAGADKAAGAATATVTGVVRAGVGAWPAIAAAMVAHLLFMLAHESHRATAAASSPTATERQPVQATATPVEVQPAPAVQPVQPPVAVQARPVEREGAVYERQSVAAPRPSRPEVIRRAERPALESAELDEMTERLAGAGGPRELARAVAHTYFEQHGELPTVTVLVAMAQVSRGTAGTALKEIREQPPTLHIVHDQNQASADQ